MSPSRRAESKTPSDLSAPEQEERGQHERRRDAEAGLVLAGLAGGVIATAGLVPGLVGLVRALALADESDRLVLVEERTFSERNYAGGEAEELYERLRARGPVVDTGGVLGAVEWAIDGAERQREA